jgi:hypothetical protein
MKHMRKNTLIIFLIAAVLAGTVSACSSGPKIQFSYHIMDERKPYGGALPAASSGAALELNLKLLDISDGKNEALKALLRALFYGGRPPAAYAENTATEYRGRYRDIEDTYQGDPDPPQSVINLSYTETFDVSFSGRRLLVISRDWDYFTGGAHGMQEREWFVIDKDVPARLLPEDILKAGTEEHLRVVVMDALNSRGLLLNEGVTNLLNFKITNNFFFNSDGIGFSWDPYEIAPYSEGIVSVVIPYAKIEEFLNKRGLELVKDAKKNRKAAA